MSFVTRPSSLWKRRQHQATNHLNSQLADAVAELVVHQKRAAPTAKNNEEEEQGPVTKSLESNPAALSLQAQNSVMSRGQWMIPRAHLPKDFG